MDFEVIRKLFHIYHDDGFPEDDICKACEKYGNLPLVLQEYYWQLGNYKQLNQSQNMLCHPNQLIETNEHLIFYKENQYAAQWAIKKSDLAKDNPPVYCSWDETVFELECDNLQDFLNAMAFFQAASWGLEYCSEDLYMISEEQAQVIRNHYKKKDYELHRWMDIEFYGNWEDEVICMIKNSDYDMLFASSNQQHFNELKAFIDKLELESY